MTQSLICPTLLIPDALSIRGNCRVREFRLTQNRPLCQAAGMPTVPSDAEGSPNSKAINMRRPQFCQMVGDVRTPFDCVQSLRREQACKVGSLPLLRPKDYRPIRGR